MIVKQTKEKPMGIVLGYNKSKTSKSFQNPDLYLQTHQQIAKMFEW